MLADANIRGQTTHRRFRLQTVPRQGRGQCTAYEMVTLPKFYPHNPDASFFQRQIKTFRTWLWITILGELNLLSLGVPQDLLLDL
jgi:hypothetical protein